MIRTCIVFLLALGLGLPLHAGLTFNPGVESTANIRVEIESWLESCPQYGMAPLKIRIRNDEKKAHTWKVRSGNSYNQGGMQMETLITVEAGQDLSQMFYAPVTFQAGSGYYYGNLQVTVEGHGISRSHAGNLSTRSSGYRGSSTDYIGMGKKLSSKGWSALRDKVNEGKGSSKSTGGELIGSELDITSAPEDWQGYSGLAQLWLDAGEWGSLGEKARAAVLEWVAMGGRLFVLNAGTFVTEMRDLFPMVKGELMEPGKMRHGSGVLETFRWDGSAFPLDAVHQRVREGAAYGLSGRLDDYVQKWPLRERVGNLKLKSGLIFGFIVVFGLLVGPVNLFWLAGSRRRHRLFWTTPLLSLGGSALLVTLMILQDGTGGSGARVVVATLLPDQKKLAITQEQVARTGVLLGSDFPVSEPTWMLPLALDSDRLGGLAFSSRADGAYADNGMSRWGSWFASRSVQAHLIRSIRPSRAGVEYFPVPDPAGKPSVISNVEVPMVKLFVVDDQGQYWMAEDVGTGEKKVLQPSTKNDFKTWLRVRALGDAGPVVQQTLIGLGVGVNLEEGKGLVFAEAADASKLAVPTLASIRWKDDRLIVAGRYTLRP